MMKSVKEALKESYSYSSQWLYKIFKSTRRKLEQTVQGWLVVYKNIQKLETGVATAIKKDDCGMGVDSLVMALYRCGC